MDRIRTRALGDPLDPNARMVPLYHDQTFFINRKCQNLSNSNSPKDFWHLAKNISNNFTSSTLPPLFHLDSTTAISCL
ncbi:hypothetical protein E2C01_065158 [Portunus trituberculatus]|uniref:Uncharacterized protein n=1 Tax=Portunus trituberculatus TaxID=210409 RepID=A0A5B7HMQ3_PORTR|nr:hypothetical protein [Portunus trituberculatus]